jgi:hypothetical protein
MTTRDLRDRIEVLDDLASMGLRFEPIPLDDLVVGYRDMEPTAPVAHRGVVLPTSERPWRPAPMPARHRWLERLVFRP